MTPQKDIAELLSEAAQSADPEMAALLKEAAETILTLRELVGIRQEIELEDAEPEGNA